MQGTSITLTLWGTSAGQHIASHNHLSCFPSHCPTAVLGLTAVAACIPLELFLQPVPQFAVMWGPFRHLLGSLVDWDEVSDAHMPHAGSLPLATLGHQQALS